MVVFRSASGRVWFVCDAGNALAGCVRAGILMLRHVVVPNYIPAPDRYLHRKDIDKMIMMSICFHRNFWIFLGGLDTSRGLERQTEELRVRSRQRKGKLNWESLSTKGVEKATSTLGTAKVHRTSNYNKSGANGDGMYTWLARKLAVPLVLECHVHSSRFRTRWLDGSRLQRHVEGPSAQVILHRITCWQDQRKHPITHRRTNAPHIHIFREN